MTKVSVTCTEFTRYHRNTLRGFAVIRLPELKLVVHDVTVHEHASGARWAALPAKPLIDRARIAKRDPSTQKIVYQPVLELEGRETRDAFSRAVVNAVLDFDPHAFDEQAA